MPKEITKTRRVISMIFCVLLFCASAGGLLYLLMYRQGPTLGLAGICGLGVILSFYWFMEDHL